MAVVIRQVVPDGGVGFVELQCFFQLFALSLLVADVAEEAAIRDERADVIGVLRDESLVALPHRGKAVQDFLVQILGGCACTFGGELGILANPLVRLGLRGVVRLHQFLELFFDRVIGLGGFEREARLRMDEIADGGGLIRRQQRAESGDY